MAFSTDSNLGLLEYDPGTHQYRHAGRDVPGITRLLGELGYNKGARFFTEESRQRGQAVHKVLFHLERLCPDAKTLEEVLENFDALDERLHPYVSQYLAFKAETGFVAVHLEGAVYSVRMRAAGRFDIIGAMPDGTVVIVDYKTWKQQGHTPKRGSLLQTAFYKMAAEETIPGLKIDRRIVLKLSGEGCYRAYQCKDAQDEIMVQMCAKVWWDLKDNGLFDPNESPEEED